MAVDPPAQSVYRLVLNQRYVNTVTVANTLHVFSRTQTPTVGAIASDFIGQVFPTWRARTCGNMSFESLTVEEFVPNPNNRGVTPINLFGQQAFPVGQAAILAPAPLAMVVTWRSGFPGRRGRGRLYRLGDFAINNDGLKWHQSNLDNVFTIMDVVRDHYELGANSMALELCVFSRLMGGRKPPYSADGVHKITAFTVQPYYATMGSRRLGHGI